MWQRSRKVDSNEFSSMLDELRRYAKPAFAALFICYIGYLILHPSPLPGQGTGGATQDGKIIYTPYDVARLYDNLLPVDTKINIGLGLTPNEINWSKPQNLSPEQLERAINFLENRLIPGYRKWLATEKAANGIGVRNLEHEIENYYATVADLKQGLLNKKTPPSPKPEPTKPLEAKSSHIFKSAYSQEEVEEVDESNAKTNAYFTGLDSLNHQLFLQQVSLGQAEVLRGKTVYIWDFITRDGDINDLTTSFTDEFEEALIQTRYYKVLERRNYARLFSQKEIEKGIMGIEQISKPKIENLKALEANMVIFGELFDDTEAGQLKVSISIQSFSGQIVIKESTFLSRGKRFDAESRREAMKELAKSVVHDQKREPDVTKSTQSQRQSISPATSTSIFFQDDFSQYELGDIVESWGTNIMVKSNSGFKYITSHAVGIQNEAGSAVNFPTDFEFEFLFTRHNFSAMGVSFELYLSGDSNVKFNFWPYVVKVNEARMELSKNYWPADRWNKIRIVKKGAALKVFINDQLGPSISVFPSTKFSKFYLAWRLSTQYDSLAFAKFLGKAL
ncbi:hypothetical protein KJ068_28375 [bacterium]|nr:hypothetical protein [bacterium]